MNLVDYLNKYKNVTFKQVPFNEVDALALALMSYFPFDQTNKKAMNSKAILSFLQNYEPERTTERKLLDIYVLTTLCSSLRFKGIKFTDFTKKRCDVNVEQFQAVTINFKNFIYVSFCGTDATRVGWREDMNMSFLDIVPSEIDAIAYINKIKKKHPFKKIYIGGHSKGGRLAIRAGKEIYKKNNLACIFSFDGPNFTDSFYDSKYDEMKHLIYDYAPNESIIGRLINDKPGKIIVESDATLLNQHNGYTWQVEDDHFVHASEYTARSNKIVRIANETYNNFTTETKSVFVSTLFDLLEKMDMSEFKNSEFNKHFIISALSTMRIEWKNIPKEDRNVILKILFTILISFIKRN